MTEGHTPTDLVTFARQSSQLTGMLAHEALLWDGEDRICLQSAGDNLRHAAAFFGNHPHVLGHALQRGNDVLAEFQIARLQGWLDTRDTVLAATTVPTTRSRKPTIGTLLRRYLITASLSTLLKRRKR